MAKYEDAPRAVYVTASFCDRADCDGLHLALHDKDDGVIAVAVLPPDVVKTICAMRLRN